MSKKTTLALAVLAAFAATTGSLMAVPPTPNIPSPDAGSSAMLLTAACAGIATVRRFIRK